MTPIPYTHQGFRIPTIVGLILVLVVVGVVIAFFERFSRGSTGAIGSVIPQDVTVTNISDKGFTVVWTTQNPATGAITILSPKHSPSTAFDDRDTNQSMKAYITHSVTLRTLIPGTSYSFRILSNGKNYIDENKSFSATTAPTIPGDGSGLEPAYGTITDSTGSPVSGAIILITLQGSQLLSTITSLSGTWLSSFGFARNASLTKFLSNEGRLTETIRVLYNGQESTAITDTLNDAPVPTMILGKTYDFRKQQATAPKNTTITQNAKESSSVLGDTTTSKSSNNNVLSLTSPAQNAALTTTIPLIQGTGIPGKIVSIVIGITNPLSATASVAKDGIWRYTPTKSLGVGKQSVTVTSVTMRGKPVAITNTFTVLKSGSQVLGDATPSASLTPTFTPTPTASSEASPTATPTPQLEGEPVPTSGTTLPTILLLLIGLTMMTGGVVLFSR